MANSPEQRNKILWEMVVTGNEAVVNAINKQTEASTRLTDSISKLSDAQKKTEEQHDRLPAKVDKTTSSLQAASDAAYKWGMGAAYAQVPMTGFIATAGNLINGVGMMQGGFMDLTAGVGKAGLAIAGITIGVV